MYYVCKGCDDCCKGCCNCCEECCGECCDAISNCFSTPFSFCAFLTFFVAIIPFILMLVAISQSSDYDCVSNIKTYLIVQAINNLINFIFCVYLTCQYGYYGKQYDDQNKTFLDRTFHLILYDWFVCIYIFALIFFIVWLALGFSEISKEPSFSPCRTENNGFLITAFQINNICMIAYLVIGFIIFIITIIIYSCDEGSCSCGGLFRCCCLIVTCGLCDIGSNDEKYQKNYNQKRKDKYKDSRKSWLHSSKRLCGCLSLSKKNHRMDTMNNVQMTDQRQQYQQPVQQQQYYQPQQQQQQYYQQNYQIQQQQQQDTSIFGQLKNWFKEKTSNKPQQQYGQQPQYQNQQQQQYGYVNQQQPYYQQPQQQYYYQQQPQQGGWGK